MLKTTLRTQNRIFKNLHSLLLKTFAGSILAVNAMFNITYEYVAFNFITGIFSWDFYYGKP